MAGQRGQITAVLGPTNTGKTHLAIERMLGHTSGMIGFPLRLLARENYDRVVKTKGQNQVALVTGEEKILPANPRYFVCTTESMPTDRPVEFLAVDEIQLAADPERGHIFTDRLLRARGLSETMFLGADTMRAMVRALVPEAQIIARPRFSTLSYAGPRKITRLPARSAVVAFSANDVYATAELLRRNRGGTAVVLGALSPRTRNRQVAMFENGEVDYLVATDAIGMGLNLNLDHVAFAKLGKFDGRTTRPLTSAEVGQIAGRAGRHMANGTFGTTAHVGDIDAETVEAVEAHRFDPVEQIAWRNPDLDFKSPGDLLKSLEVTPPNRELTKGRDADDYSALRALARDPDIADMAATPADVRLLWEVCQVPDFRKVMSDQHARLLAQIYKGLMRDGHLSGDWVGRQIDRLDRTDGDIDSLIGRIAHIRTWTFITHRGDWVADSQHWQARARAIEDRLSDALHDGLTQRFVDRRTAALVKRMSEGSDLIGAVRRNGEVLVEGEYVGRLEGFAFSLDAEAPGSDTRPLLTAARKALSGEIPGRVKSLEGDADGSFSLDAGGGIRWRGQAVAEMIAGPDALRPQVRVYDTDFLDGALRERIRKRLAVWLSRHTRNRLAALFALAEADLPPRPRGLAFQLVEAMGVLRRADVAEHVKALTRHERKLLRQHGVRLGHECIWVPAALKPKADRMKALLTAVHRGDDPRALPSANGPAFRPTAATDDAMCRVLGYRRIEPPRRGRDKAPADDEVVAVRVDVLEQLAGALSKLQPSGPFTPVAPLTDPLADDREALALALPALGYARSGGANAETPQAFRPWRGGARQVAPAGKAQGQRGRKRKQTAKRGESATAEQPSQTAGKPPRKKQGRKPAPARQQKRRTRTDPDHPFAKLQEITFRE